MDHAHHPSHVTGSPPQPDHPASLNHVALLATLHCSTGCGIGEVAGMVIGTALGWGIAKPSRWQLRSHFCLVMC